MNTVHWKTRFRAFAAQLQAPLTALLRGPAAVRYAAYDEAEPEKIAGFTFFFRLVGEKIAPGLVLGFEFEPALLLGVLDRLQGGDGVHLEEDSNSARPLTGLEKWLTSKFLLLLNDAIRQTWGLEEPFDFELTGPLDWGGEVFFAAPIFQLNVGPLDGNFRILIPRLHPQPMRNSQISRSVRAEEDEEDATDALALTPVKISVQLAGSRIRPQDLLRWKVGDVVSLGRPEDFPFNVLVEGMEKFTAAPGRFKSRKAFRIL
ncbi:MAG: FliM/FliN family flagellar motor switch protein [Thermoguttaceae bacterium]|nr:FliM/FliN family flagellar motor switch protein [Thermoguttaceae bacterium]